MAAQSQGNPWYIAGFVLVVFLLSWHFFTLRSTFDQRGLSEEQLQMMEFNGDIVRATDGSYAWNPEKEKVKGIPGPLAVLEKAREELAEAFVKHNFDVRYLIRLIMNSRAYQASSVPNDSNAEDEVNYSHATVRRLGAEQLLDCQSQVAGVPLKFSGYPRGMRAAQLPGVRPEAKGQRRANQLDRFLELFGKPPRLLTTDTERSCECNMGQAFQLISGPTVNQLLSEKENRITRLIAESKTNREMIDDLFWSALTRAPTEKEASELLPRLDQSDDIRAQLEDILWGLLNSKEFVFRW